MPKRPKTIKVQLTESQCMRLELRETKVKLLQQQIKASVDLKYATQAAAEMQKILDTHPDAKKLDKETGATVDQVLDELRDTKTLPAGYSVTEFLWEQGVATAVYDPKAAGKRMQPAAPAVPSAPPDLDDDGEDEEDETAPEGAASNS